MKRILCSSLALIALSSGVSACSLNTTHRTGQSGIVESSDGKIDQETGDIMTKEIDADGDLINCTTRKASWGSDLPSCNEIIAERKKVLGKRETTRGQQSSELFSTKISGDNSFKLPNGAKINIKTRVIYNDESSNALIVNAIVSREVDLTSSVFEKLFFRGSGARMQLNFVDKEDFEVLDPLSIPLDVAKGMRANIKYTKQFGMTTSDVKAVRIQARKPIRSVREYREISNIRVSFRP